MKVSFLFPVFLAATQFVTTMFASASEPSPEAARDAEIIRRHDTNQDGVVDEAEIAAVKEQMLKTSQEKRAQNRERIKARMKAFDTDGDGQLDEQEKSAREVVLRARVAKRPGLLRRLDADRDGSLSDAEWAAGREKVMGQLLK